MPSLTGRVKILEGHTNLVTSVLVCDDYMITGSADFTIKLWKLTIVVGQLEGSGLIGRVCVCFGFLSTWKMQRGILISLRAPGG